MRLGGLRQSTNVEDRRRPSNRGLAIGGGSVAMLVAALYVMLGGAPEDAQVLLQNADATINAQQTDGPLTDKTPNGIEALSPREVVQGQEAAKILALTEDVWIPLLARYNVDYAEPTMVLFSSSVESACGHASAATGPFYCPGDAKLYLDTSFFDELAREYGAPGDFARAYVIAHEVGHHVQNLLGYTAQIEAQRGRVTEAQMNALSVRLELQADYLAGVFTHHLRARTRILESGDIEEALRCASSIGDDRLQRREQGFVVPESFTHGTSDQRERWFRRGFETGDLTILPQFFNSREL